MYQIPKKSPIAKKIQEFSPKSSPTKRNFNTAESSNPKASEPPVSTESKKTKPIAERVIEEGIKGSQAESTTTISDLPAEMLKLILQKAPDIGTMASISKAAKTLHSISKETDVQNLRQYSETHPWTLKNEMALRILMLAGTDPKPVQNQIEDLKKLVTLPPKITIEEAKKILPLLDNNWERCQKGYNGLLNSLSQSLPSIDVLRSTGVGFIILAYIQESLGAQGHKTFNDYMSLSASYCLFIGISSMISGNILGWNPITLFREAANHTLSDIYWKLKHQRIEVLRNEAIISKDLSFN